MGEAGDYATVYAEFKYTGGVRGFSCDGEWRWSAFLGKSVPKQYTADLFIQIMRIEALGEAGEWKQAKEALGEAPIDHLALVGEK